MVLLSTHIMFWLRNNFFFPVKVRKTAKIRNRYNQLPHLAQDTTWESDKKTQLKISNKSQEGDHKAAMNRCETSKHDKHKE